MAETKDSVDGAFQLGLRSLIKRVFGDLTKTPTEMHVIKYVEKMLEKAKSTDSKMATGGAQDFNADTVDGLGKTDQDGTMKEIGKMAYFLLCGRHPYRISEKIWRLDPTFAEAPWHSQVSDIAKSFVKSLLGVKPPTFAVAENLLVCWRGKDPCPELDASVVTVMKDLQKHSTFQQWALKVLGNILTEDQIKSLYENQFRVIDVDGNGKITIEEFRSAIQSDKASALKDGIFEEMDTDGNKVVVFEEFKHYFSHSPNTFLVKLGPSTKQLIEDIFSKLDDDSDGKITQLELQMSGTLDCQEMIKTFIAETDTIEDGNTDMTGDGNIPLPEFEKRMRAWLGMA